MIAKKSKAIVKRKKAKKVFSSDELLPKKEFLARFKIKKEDFVKTGLIWVELTKIYKDYLILKPSLEHPAKALVDILFTNNARERGIHSVRFRIKDANSLIEKIIRKKILKPRREINIQNYRKEITDLIGIRALHVFKNELYGIHHFIIEMFNLKKNEKPIHYHREGDDKEFIKLCKDFGCKQEVHEKGYRSVHYIVSTQLTKEIYYAEIQIRTIFQEGWSEIDHKIRYSYKDSSASPFENELSILNNIAGNADDSGSNIKRLEQKEQERILKPLIKRRKK
jgi:ppGpp synthetase/RelA/SpoT-type nucleotidyltranferase